MSAELDLAIVGGGPAGLAVAIGARLRLGGRVAVFDPGRPPRDKPCGEGLMPDGREVLAGLGVQVTAGARFRGIRYLEGPDVATGYFPPDDVGLGIRRTALHEALVVRAEAVGVELHWGTRVAGLATGSVLTAAGSVAARWLVGADGLRSRVRTWAGLAGPEVPTSRRRFGVRRHYALAPWADVVEVYWADGAEAYVTPVGAGSVGVALLWSGAKTNFEALLARFPALAERLAGVPVISADRGCGPLRQRARAVQRGRLALVGDAAGYLDAITGEGLSLAFHQAQALVTAIGEVEAGRARDLTGYSRAHHQLGRLPNTLTHLLLAVERRPALRRRLIRALAADPALFSRLLALHVRALRPRDLGAAGALRLVWRLATA